MWRLHYRVNQQYHYVLNVYPINKSNLTDHIIQILQVWYAWKIIHQAQWAVSKKERRAQDKCCWEKEKKKRPVTTTDSNNCGAAGFRQAKSNSLSALHKARHLRNLSQAQLSYVKCSYVWQCQIHLSDGV